MRVKIKKNWNQKESSNTKGGEKIFRQNEIQKDDTQSGL